YFLIEVMPADYNGDSEKWEVKQQETRILAKDLQGAALGFSWTSSYGSKFNSEFKGKSEAIATETGSATLKVTDNSNGCKDSRKAELVFLKEFSWEWTGKKNQHGIGEGTVTARSSQAAAPYTGKSAYLDGDLEFTIKAEEGSYIKSVRLTDARGIETDIPIDDDQLMSYTTNATNGGKLTVVFAKSDKQGGGSGSEGSGNGGSSDDDDDDEKEGAETPVSLAALSEVAVVSPFTSELVLLHADNCVAYELYTEMGKLVMQGVAKGQASVRIQMGDAPQGVYLVRLYAADGSFRVLKAIKL
ncbi:MAG: hypothetical protein CSA97_05025, partial [Bacteroidetes bacterium]